MRKELSELREEIEQLRAEARAGRPGDAEPAAADGAQGDQDGEPKAWTEQLKETITAVQAALEGAERSVVDHPVAGVAAAFVAGLLIGRLTKIE